MPHIIPTRSRGRAFTLIELLTVIAIIGILAAILIPVVGKVRSSARGAQCVSNLRQVGLAVLGFASENKGLVPHGDGPILESWRAYRPGFTGNTTSLANLLQSYVTGANRTVSSSGDNATTNVVFLCPAGKSTVMNAGGTPFEGYGWRGAELAGLGATPTRIAMRMTNAAGTQTNYVNVNRLEAPSRTVLGGDWRDNNFSVASPAAALAGAGARHSARVQFVRFDGSVTAFPVAEAEASMVATNSQYNLFWRGF